MTILVDFEGILNGVNPADLFFIKKFFQEINIFKYIETKKEIYMLTIPVLDFFIDGYMCDPMAPDYLDQIFNFFFNKKDTDLSFYVY